ncbi:FAD-binding oxidoreductase [Sphingosinithalassobacter portus]|uniref:FAD-binding oxidoreductase n=1 Tax=Stakelama portus TaxID=2676234 RepID=UPI000D6DCFCC|nr:FAD-binding oxidoreductase [Sphingosinithalassobacter portus]
MATRADTQNPLDSVREAVGGDALVLDETTLALHGQDVFTIGEKPLAVFRPTSVEMLASGVGAATAAGLAVVPRGGGMSYTSGYLGDAQGFISIDMGGLDRIVSINREDMHVVVEAGCTWQTLYEALHPLGLRVPAWGTLSGTYAQIGGGMSQNGVFWGGGRGPIAQTPMSYDIVLANGTLLTTGNATMRPYGPDLTGIFSADSGALGIKARVTLPLIPEAKALAYGSFSFAKVEGFLAAASQISREQIATEIFGFDPFLQAQRMRRESLAKDAKALLGMMKSQGGFWKGIREGAKVVSAGRNFLDAASFSLHLIAEGRNDAAASADMARIEQIALANGGTKTDNTIPKIMRSSPFPDVNSIVGPNGERWVPTHGILRHSTVLPALEAIIAYYESHAEDMERLQIGAGYLFLTCGTTAFLMEPVFFWPDAMEDFHRRYLTPEHRAKLTDFPPNPEARALVEKLRKGVLEILGRFGAAHLQIGRSYPYSERIAPEALELVRAIKRDLDPHNLMNPGALRL